MAILRHGREPERRWVPGRRLLAPGRVLALCSVAVLAAACSAGSSGRQVASLPGHSTGPARTTLTQAQSDQDFVNFAHCMRSHGVQMSDPFHVAGHAGLSIEFPPHNAATKTAWAACNHYIQAIVAMKMAHANAVAAPNLDALTRYAQCMRAHDINMLDPTSFGALNLGNVPGMANNNYGRYSPQFRAADTACRHLLPPGVTDNGTGP